MSVHVEMICSINFSNIECWWSIENVHFGFFSCHYIMNNRNLQIRWTFTQSFVIVRKCNPNLGISYYIMQHFDPVLKCRLVSHDLKINTLVAICKAGALQLATFAQILSLLFSATTSMLEVNFKEIIIIMQGLHFSWKRLIILKKCLGRMCYNQCDQ